MHYALQGTLLGSLDPSVDPTFAGSTRLELDERSTGFELDGDDAWVELVPGWVAGADRLFDDLLEAIQWEGRRVHMYDKVLDQPRLNGSLDVETRPEIVERMRCLLSGRYGVEFTSVRANLYRDGRDSVAWHGDRVARDLPQALVAIVSLGGRRRSLVGGQRGAHADAQGEAQGSRGEISPDPRRFLRG